MAQFGPHLNYPPREGYPGRDEPDKIVETHCCFCGMQCGIKLLVKNNKVVGFEPWEEFPFNQGRLCPKGVQRYLQNNHPDRLLHPLERAEGAGFPAHRLGARAQPHGFGNPADSEQIRS